MVLKKNTMAFRSSQPNSRSNTTSASGMYRAAQKTQLSFECGWDTSKYLSTGTDSNTWGTRAFSSVSVNPQKQGQKTLKPQQAYTSNSRAVPNSAPARSSLAQQSSSSNQTQYFMAGRRGCPFVTKTLKAQQELGLQNVTNLMCDNPQDAGHAVCQMTRANRRGTPSYYKQVGSNKYEFIKSGFDRANPASFMQ